MSITPPAPVLLAQQTFRVLLNAMSRPGMVHQLAVRDGEPTEVGVLFTLLDFEVRYAIANPGTQRDTQRDMQRDTRSEGDIAALEQRIALLTGSQRVAIGDAAFVLSYGPLPHGAWGELRRGTLAYPDGGATVIFVVPQIGEASVSDERVEVVLTGPGVETEQRLMIAGLPTTEFQEFARVNADYPMGVDVMLIDPSGRVACIPRSSAVRVQRATAGEG